MVTKKQAKENFRFFNEGDYITREMAESKDVILEYVEQLEKEIKNKNTENLCDECSSMAKECGFTEEDLDRIVAETREMQTKAEKYDLLIEKLEEDIKQKNILLYVDDITDILTEVEED